MEPTPVTDTRASGALQPPAASFADIVLTTDDGVAIVRERGDGTREVSLTMNAGAPASPRQHIVTRYSPALLGEIIRVKGAGWLVDEIARDEDPAYVADVIGRVLAAFVPPRSLSGARILDFGCGSGASTFVLRRCYPDAREIIGIDFKEDFLEIAEARRRHYGETRIRFDRQPPGGALRIDGRFDLIVLSAVVEHMLPLERREVLPQLWSAIKPGGRIFVSDTPHRWFPLEAHTTNLWGLNFQSDAAALRRTLRSANTGCQTWDALLRAGIRGSTEAEILDCLTGGHPEMAREVKPADGRRRVDIWYEGLTPGRHQWLKRAARELLAVAERLTGTLLTQNVTYCVEKRPTGF
jgi:2-polyprenyl-3-methyl-5-hydroxy-6-metoxy-1,4-benzoquinol methylase